MKTVHKITAAAISASLLAGAAFADGDFDRQIKVRKAHNTLFSAATGPLNAMVKEEMPYNAEVAQRSADNLLVLTQFDQTGLWPEGSDNTQNETKSLPAIWEDFADFEDKYTALATAAVDLQTVAGTDLATMSTAMETVGGTCGACHKSYRYSDK